MSFCDTFIFTKMLYDIGPDYVCPFCNKSAATNMDDFSVSSRASASLAQIADSFFSIISRSFILRDSRHL